MVSGTNCMLPPLTQGYNTSISYLESLFTLWSVPLNLKESWNTSLLNFLLMATEPATLPTSIHNQLSSEHSHQVFRFFTLYNTDDNR